MSTNAVLPALLLLARPGAGKSEVIHFLKSIPLEERISRYHVGALMEIDDFPMLWTWFEEDVILQKMGKPRLHSDEHGYFLYPYLWNVLVERICLDYAKSLRDADSHGASTRIIEFARGSEHGGFRTAFEYLSDQVLRDAAILYINVSWEESLRKNRKRFNPDRPDSILQHSLPDEKLERLYKDSDWVEITLPDPDFIDIKGHQVPYAVMENEDDVTSQPGSELAARLEKCLTKLAGNKF